jgi:putative phosphoesterase
MLIIALINNLSTNVEVLDEIPEIEKEPGIKIVGLISDTHLPSRAHKIPDKVFEVFKNADLIIHAGDLTSTEVIEELEKIAPVVAVHGNMDPYDVKTKLPEKNFVEIYHWKIGIIHESSALIGMGEMKTIAEKNDLDVLVFGHLHRPIMKWEDDVLFINLGSPVDPLTPVFVKLTVGLLIITEDGIRPVIVRV